MNGRHHCTDIKSSPLDKVGVFSIELGWIAVSWSKQGVKRVTMPKDSRQSALNSLETQIRTIGFTGIPPSYVIDQIEACLDGQSPNYESPLDFQGIPPFTKSVLEKCKEIPIGETRSYSWIAASIGRDHAYRAVGHSLSKNPLPFLIPCHRVISKNGNLNGYVGGPTLKQTLLTKESSGSSFRYVPSP